MTLIHDPSAIRYASTQEAYDTTWTLDKVEDDGAQVWKNAKGQTALVQKAVEQVRQQLPPRPVWTPINIGQENESFKKIERKPIKSDDAAKAAIRAAIQTKTGPFPAIISNASINNLVNAAGYSSKSKDLDMPRPDPPYTNELHFTPGVSKYTPAPGSYVGERKISPVGVTREWNGIGWIEVNKAGDRKVSADASREWEYDGAEWKRVR